MLVYVEIINYICIDNKTKEMKTLFVSIETFNDMLLGFIKSGVTFESEERNGGILITFTGGY
jgi:hypothetical protein